MADPLLDVRELETKFFLKRGILTAVDRVSFQLHRQETLGIVGETGSGKSVLALSLIRLVPSPPGRITHGQVCLNGEDLLQKPEPQMRRFRGRRISMIFQEPMVALNPAYTVGQQVAESFTIHDGLSKRDAYARAADMLNRVGIPNASERLKSYPHEFSGCMRQRVMIAIALACNPDILMIADEPTTALDVTIQAQILDLLRELLAQLGKALIFITHDLGVAAVLCDRIAVMYGGNIVELASRDAIFEKPLHPYTQGLLRALPRRGARRKLLDPIPGVVCNLMNPPVGCKFVPRCEQARELCSRERPVLRQVENDRWMSCHL
jgi:oligopeptide/dipeptide ABC transporter ATP-binding protein